jgi:hypothetical protein
MSTLGCNGCDRRPKPDGVQHIIDATKNSTCTAAFINDYQAVTAAHCLFDKDGNFQNGLKLKVSFKGGQFAHGKGSTSESKEVKIQAACFHPEFPKFMSKIDKAGFEHVTPLTLSPFDFAIINIGGHICQPDINDENACVPGPNETLADFEQKISKGDIPGMTVVGTSLRQLYLRSGLTDFNVLAESRTNGYARIMEEYLNLENANVKSGPFNNVMDEASLFVGKVDIEKAWITGLGPSSAGEADEHETDIGSYNIATLGADHFEINTDLGVILSKRKIGTQEAPHIGKGDSGSPLYWRMNQTKEHDIFQRYSQATLTGRYEAGPAAMLLEEGTKSSILERFRASLKVKMVGGINSSFSRQFGIYSSPISRYNRIITQSITWPNRTQRIKVGDESRTISMINEFGLIDLRSKRYSAGEGGESIFTCNLNAAARQVQDLHANPEVVKNAACGGLVPEEQSSCNPQISNCLPPQGVFCPGNSHDTLKNHFSKSSGEILEQKVADLTYMSEYFTTLKGNITDKPRKTLNISEMQRVFADQDAQGFQSLVLHDLAVRPRPYARVGMGRSMRAELHLNLAGPDPEAGEAGLEVFEKDDMQTVNQELKEKLAEVEYFDWSTNNAELPILAMGTDTSASFKSLFVFKNAKDGECRGAILDLGSTGLLNVTQKSVSDKHWAVIPAHCLESARNTGNWSITDAIDKLGEICSDGVHTRMQGFASLPFECLNLSQAARLPKSYSDVTDAGGTTQQMAQHDMVLFPVRAKAGQSLQGMIPQLEISAQQGSDKLYGFALTDGSQIYGNITTGYHNDPSASINLVINPSPYGNATNAGAIQIHNVQTEPNFSGAILFAMQGEGANVQIQANCMHIGPLTGSDLQFSNIGNRCIHFSILKSVFAEGQGFVNAVGAPAAQAPATPTTPDEVEDPEEPTVPDTDAVTPTEPPAVAGESPAPIVIVPVVQNTVPNQAIPAPQVAILPTSCDSCSRLESSCFCCSNSAGLNCNLRADAPSSTKALTDIPVIGRLPNGLTVYRKFSHKDSGTSHRYWFEVETDTGLRGFVWEPSP